MADSARSIGFTTGDPTFASDMFMTGYIMIPGTVAPTAITIEGNVAPIGGPLIPITGSPLTGPVIPASGSTYWIIQVNTATGAASIKTSPTSFPAPDASNVTEYQDVLASTDTSIAQDTTSVTIDL